MLRIILFFMINGWKFLKESTKHFFDEIDVNQQFVKIFSFDKKIEVKYLKIYHQISFMNIINWHAHYNTFLIISNGVKYHIDYKGLIV